MKSIEVVAAIIRDERGRIFATQRGYGAMKDGWEFPGGKIELGETSEQALEREIREELDTLIGIDRHFVDVEWDYPDFHLHMSCYLCHVLKGDLSLKEHEASRWLWPWQLHEVEWLPADWSVIRKLQDCTYMKEIRTENAPAAIGPYSQAVEANGFVYASGQLPIDPITGGFPEGIEAQTRQSLLNAQAILREAGLELTDVVKTTVLLADIADFAAMNKVYAEFFKAPYPARSAFAVRSVPKGALVEIECIAARR